MGNSKSKVSFRVSGLDDQAHFEPTLAAWCATRNVAHKKSLAKSTANGAANFTGTVSCAPEHKKRLLLKSQKISLASGLWPQAAVDDCFSGLTMLYSPHNVQNIEIDICFVHGLNGNSMDTFTKNDSNNNVVVWPRDILPLELNNRARIMTFDYNSRIYDRNALNDDPAQWARDLLQRVEYVRNHTMKDRRPIIFIAHSLGGLVVRFAATELHQNAQSYGTISIRDCGFLFLATPHRGSTEADYGPATLKLVKFLLAPRSRDIIRKLSTRLDNGLLGNLDLWTEIEAQSPRPIRCFAEGRQTRVPVLGHRTIVTQASAGFQGREAEILPNTDHHTICKIGNVNDAHFPAFIRRAIFDIRHDLLNQQPLVPPPQALVPPPQAPIQVNMCLIGENMSMPLLIPSFSVNGVKGFLGLTHDFRVWGANDLATIAHLKPATVMKSIVASRGETESKDSPKAHEDLKAGTADLADRGGDDEINPISDPNRSSILPETRIISDETTHIQPDDVQVREAWEKKAILCIDGGATRNYISLLLLRALMQEIKKLEDLPTSPSSTEVGPAKFTGSSGDYQSPKPCHYFDYISGSSTGGLLAIMLGRLRMDVDQCIHEFKTLSEKLFAPSRSFSRRWFNRAKYDTLLFEAECKRIIKTYPTFEGEQSPEGPFASPSDVCQTMVMSLVRTKSQSVDSVHIFRTYQNASTTESERGKKPRIWQVARATSASPTYFKPMSIGGKDYIDGGFMINNPSAEIFWEVHDMNGHAKSLVSLGAGVLEQSQAQYFQPGLFGKPRHIRNWKQLRGYSMDSEFAHNATQRLLKSTGAKYFRFNVPLDSKDWGLDSWTKSRKNAFHHLEHVTYKYLQQKDTLALLQKCARELVEQRKLRSLDGAAWEKFTA